MQLGMAHVRLVVLPTHVKRTASVYRQCFPEVHEQSVVALNWEGKGPVWATRYTEG